MQIYAYVYWHIIKRGLNGDGQNYWEKNCRRKLAKTMWKPLGKPLNVDKEIYAKRKILQYFIDEKQKQKM